MSLRSFLVNMTVLVLLSSILIISAATWVTYNRAYKNYEAIAAQVFDTTFEVYGGEIIGSILIGDKNILESLINEVAVKRHLTMFLSTQLGEIRTGAKNTPYSKTFSLQTGGQKLGYLTVGLAESPGAGAWLSDFLISLIIEITVLGFSFYILWALLKNRVILPLSNILHYVQTDTLKDMSISGKPLNELTQLAQILKVMNFEIEAKARSSAQVEVARQVAHDIRSPLSALNMISSSLTEVSEEKRLIIRNATQRINDIANNLLQKSKATSEPPNERTAASHTVEPVMLSALLDTIVSEKRVQFRDRSDFEIQANLNNGYGLFTKVDPVELSRSISNLINNSVEALNGPGQINIGIHGDTKSVIISVVDNGRGIAPEVLDKLGQRGVSHGKNSPNSGAGLGLYHARKTVEASGGQLTIQSKVNQGTLVTLTLPRAETPSWFVEKLILPTQTTVVSVDDDQTIHQIWAGRFASAAGSKTKIGLLPFLSPQKFLSWFESDRNVPAIYLVDFEFLGDSRNGLDLVEQAGLADRAILVTSRYEEPQVRSRAKALGVRIIPKALAPFVPITFN